MEFVLLGTLALIGRTLSKRDLKFETTIDLDNQFVDKVDQHLKEPNIVPYFTSMKTQNTNDAFKNRRLQTFTGTNNIEFKHKKELESVKPESGITNVFGSTFEPDMIRYQNSLTEKFHDMTPVEKQYVGKGVGIDPRVQASGGFHDSFRVLPDNVNAYRKNNFKGDIITGKQLNDAPTLNSELTKYKTNMQTSYTPSAKAVIGSQPARSEYHDSYFKTSYCPPTNGPLRSHVPMMRNNDDMQYTEFSKEIACKNTGHMYNPIQHSSRNTLQTVHDTERDEEYCQITNAFKNSGYTQSINANTQTMREDTNCHRLNVRGNARQASNHVDLQHTQRGQHSQCYTTPAQGYVENTYVHTYENASTNRDNKNSHVNNGHYNGMYGDSQRMTLSNQRPTQSYVANGQHAQVHNANINVRYKSDDQSTEYIPHGKDISKGSMMRSKYTTSKDDYSRNNRAFGFAPTILKDNPYAISTT